MPYRIRKIFEVEKSTFRSSRPGTGTTEYSREFCVASSHDRTVEVTFETNRLADAALSDAFIALDDAIRDYLERFSGSTCVSRTDPKLAELREAYARLVVIDGEPTPSMLARLVYDHIHGMLVDGRFSALADRVSVAAVKVEDEAGAVEEFVA